MARPRLLDLFCGAGGCSVGYHRAGFDVVGVDLNPQKRYPFEFVQADALEYVAEHGHEFDAIHASPPCQAFSSLRHRTGKEYPDLVAPMRQLLRASGKPYVIENVEGAPLLVPMRLCGSAFGLAVRRHRLFETSVPLHGKMCEHWNQPDPVDVSGTGLYQHKPREKQTGGKSRKPFSLAHARECMGIDWMERKEISQAIPPAYTEFVGRQLLEHLSALV